MRMKTEHFGFIAGLALLTGCASTGVAQKDTLNEPSDRMAVLDDRRPPNPNRPNDQRELKAVPTVVQHDPASDKPSRDQQQEDKGLAVNAGQDQLVRTQDPTRADNSPAVAAGGPATQAQGTTILKADNELTNAVKDAIRKARNGDANVVTAQSSETAKSANSEAKALETYEIAAKNGEVTLSGSVGSETERTTIEQAASRVPGVKSVANYLTISKSAQQ